MVVPSGESHVILWTPLCRKKVKRVTIFLLVAKFIKNSPFLLMHWCRVCFSLLYVKVVFFFNLRIHIAHNNLSFLNVLSYSASRELQNLPFVPTWDSVHLVLKD